MGKGETGMSNEETREVYNQNADFRKYVDAVARDLGMSVEGVMQFAAVQNMAAKAKANEMERR